MMDEIKLCPFCGGNAMLKEYSANDGRVSYPPSHFVSCITCKSTGPSFNEMDIRRQDATQVCKENAIRWWNNRI